MGHTLSTPSGVGYTLWYYVTPSCVGTPSGLETPSGSGIPSGSARSLECGGKPVMKAIFVVCRSDSTKKIAKENSFHRNLTWFYKFMSKNSLSSHRTLPRYQFYNVKYFLTSFSFIILNKSSVKFDLNF